MYNWVFSLNHRLGASGQQPTSVKAKMSPSLSPRLVTFYKKLRMGTLVQAVYEHGHGTLRLCCVGSWKYMSWYHSVLQIPVAN